MYKNKGETPLECIKRFKKDNPKYKDEKMTYAGRLDPLAEGLLLVLYGEECKNKEKYLGLDKEYEVDVLFGFATDTYDLLGMVTKIAKDGPSHFCEGPSFATQILQSFVGRFRQKYPVYSSKNIKKILNERKEKKRSLSLRRSEATGKGESSGFFDESEAKEVEIKSIKLLSKREISKSDLEKYVTDSINLVKGDFRQKEILRSWEDAFKTIVEDVSRLIRANVRIKKKSGAKNIDGNYDDGKLFFVIKIRVSCTSGTYMRSLANTIGEKIGIPALALNIKRTKLGKYKIVKVESS